MFVFFLQVGNWFTNNTTRRLGKKLAELKKREETRATETDEIRNRQEARVDDTEEIRNRVETIVARNREKQWLLVAETPPIRYPEEERKGRRIRPRIYKIIISSSCLV